MVEITKRKQHQGFQKGVSGNPAGKPKGARAVATQLAGKLLENDRDDIIKAVVAAAKNGGPTAMRLCVERLVPLRKGRPMVFPLPPTSTAGGLVASMAEVVRGTSEGSMPLLKGTEHNVNWTVQKLMESSGNLEFRSARRPAETEKGDLYPTIVYCDETFLT